MDLSGHERDKCYLSLDGKGFADASYLSGADGVEDARALALADLDRDGHEDLVVVNRNAPLIRVYRNLAGARGGRAFVGLELVGAAGRRDPVGARVEARACGRLHVAEVARGVGFGSGNSPVVTLGLDRCETIDELAVRFPSGERRRFAKIAARRLYRVAEGVGIQEIPGVYGPRAPVAAGPPTASATATRATTAARPAPGPAPAPALDALAAAVRRTTASTARLALVSLFASWCEACARDTARVDALAAALAGRAAVVGLSVEPKDDAASVAAWSQKVGARHPVAPYDPRAAAAVEALFSRRPDHPSTLHVDTATGQVLLRTRGTPTRSELERVLR
jgi:hypothetical protein